MLRSANHIRGYSIRARDGDIGRVDDFLFDDLSWVVRYLVVDTGNWLVERKVLVLPAALDAPDWEAEALTAQVTRQQIEDSPPLAVDQPVSRQKEMELHQYYGWPPYWNVSPAMMPGGQPLPASVREQAAEEARAMADQPNPNLRSVREVTGYHIQARDGEIGHVEDFIIDDEDWVIRYMIIDTRNWLPGKHVLVAPTWVEDVAWDQRKVSVDLKRETIKHSPEFDPSLPVNREYEIRLYDYYGRPQYWVRL